MTRVGSSTASFTCVAASSGGVTTVPASSGGVTAVSSGVVRSRPRRRYPPGGTSVCVHPSPPPGPLVWSVAVCALYFASAQRGSCSRRAHSSKNARAGLGHAAGVVDDDARRAQAQHGERHGDAVVAVRIDRTRRWRAGEHAQEVRPGLGAHAERGAGSPPWRRCGPTP